ncbi:hypothetical protein E1B28_001916 [Marasmius oreades]|uniref:Uncharacterized protein n=1 Tax=Marasmius oreades TaxID=181124 RepID=A0A9P8AFP2_9AGAR|nr:uncharacterized protein E1B28_001916 [Marasmius oreades]KAG7100136.1 hypothetical protein E1B28_001916 [Marasmius oreades]
MNPAFSKRGFQILSVVALAILLRLGVSTQFFLLTEFFSSPPRAAFDHIEPHQPWDLNTSPNPNNTGHLVFNVASSLLQNWPNTRYRNGHTVVPGTIPPNTLLYHGRSNSNFPNGSDWTSVDPEHSYLFCRLREECWHLTLVTTRTLRVLYFDGSSAVKMRGGSMDTQDLLIWGEARDDKAFQEEERLGLLCENWGKEFHLDGFVRMEMDFEVMLCDMSPRGGLETISFVRLHAPPQTPEDIQLRNFELVHSTSQHNHYPGETRVKLDLSRLVTLYDTALWLPSTPAPLESDRFDHRAASPWMDVEAFRRRVRDALGEGRREEKNSGVDWSALMNVILKRYGTRLETLRYILDHRPTSQLELGDIAAKAFTQLDVMMTPYIMADAIHHRNSSSNTDWEWTSSIYEMCSNSHTDFIRKLDRSLTQSERLLLKAIRETTREICRVLVKAWGLGCLRGISQNSHTANDIVNTWREDIAGLMQWLDWSLWVRCTPQCGVDELCYLPTWPFFGGPPPADVYIPEDRKPTAEEENRWRKPSPQCISRIAPYEL